MHKVCLINPKGSKQNSQRKVANENEYNSIPEPVEINNFFGTDWAGKLESKQLSSAERVDF